MITTIYRELKTLNSQKSMTQWRMDKWTELSIFKWSSLNGQKTPIKTCSTFLAIKEMEVKTMVRFHLTPVRIAIIKNINSNKSWWGCGKDEPSDTVGENVN
jgi:hypothetical protein